MIRAALALLLFPFGAVAHGTGDPLIIALAEERLALPNLPVTDRWGAKGGFRDVVGMDRSLILSFSYTECVTLCNVTNAILALVDEQLGQGQGGDARIVTVAIDGQRDSPDALQVEASALGASDRWLWLTGGAQGTRPLLETLRFPPGALEDHDPIFLVGRPCNARFTRIIGIPDPERLVALAEAQPPCGG